ncbi:hypothetical protein Tco_1177539, partial [Tanacetum coccineum]
DILLTIKDDILREKLLNVNLLIANIEALKDNPTPSSEVITKSSSTFPNFFLEETNTFDNSLTKSETFCFDLEENGSGSTTTRSDLSLPDYEAFYLNDDHIEEKSSGITTTHADFSQYDSFIFDLSINPFPPADRSDFYHEEFTDELAHIISPPEYFPNKRTKIVIPKVGGIDDNILLTIKDDILREKLLNVNLLIANIEALKDNPAPSYDVMTKSSSTSLNLFLEETNTFDNSLPESETFCFDLEEKSSGSTTTHADFSQYDSFIFDLSINPFPPIDRSDFYHEKFADELAHIISPPEYDHFYFKIEPKLGNLTMDVVNDIFPTREPRVHVPNVLPTHPTLNLDFILSSESLFTYVVWIFLPFLTYPVAPPYLLSCGNEDTVFDPGISIYHSFMPSISHRSGTFIKSNGYPNHLNESPMEILSSTCSPMDQ